jgi:hypothetical protein
MVILTLSIISLITTLIGLYLLGEKKANGFLIFTLSLACQLYIFYTQQNWFLCFQMLVLIGFNIVNYTKWSRGG